MRFFRFHGATLTLGLAIALTLSFASPLLQQTAYGQATTAAGAIQGTVFDPSGAMVPNAKVTLTQPDKGFQKVLKTSSSGFYSSGALEPGKYLIKVEAAGFSNASLQLVVQVGQTANGDMKLGLQGTVTQVMVEDTAVNVDTSGSAVEGVLNRQEIEALPLNGRNFLDMAQLQPGVQIQDGTSFDPTKNGFASISFGGRFGRTARITLDGVDISDENVGTTTQNISEDAIQEFQIAESSLDISTSLTSSGSVNIVTRSGSNKVHGDSFYNFRDQRAGNAEPTGYTVIPFVDSDYLQRNNMGAAAGGPLKRDKLFLFGQYEYFRQNVFNPVTFGGPLASADGGYPAKFHETLSLGRADWNGPHGIRAFLGIAYNNNSDVAAFGGSNYSPFLNRDNTPGYRGGVDLANGNFTHSFHGGYFKFVNHIADATTGSGIYNPTPGINLVINPFGFSTGANLLAPQATVQTNKQIKYDGSWVKGSHTLRYGIGVDKLLGGGYASFFGLAPQVAVTANCTVLRAAEAGPFPATGSAALQGTDDGCASQFGGVAAGYGAATNPKNYPAGGGGANLVTFGNGEGYFTEIPQFGFPGGGQADNRFNLYLSDTWKLGKKMTVNYGLRYIRDTGRSDSDLPPIPILDTLQAGLGDKVNQPNLNFGPQAGFAYDLKGNGKTVIRGGAGVYYENNVWNNVLFDRPPKLQKGLFFGTEQFCPSGQPWCGQPVGNVFGQIAAAQTDFQKATIAAGPQANGEYVGNLMAVPSTFGLFLFSPNYKTPSSYQMNFGIQRELHPGVVLTTDYVRNVGIHALVGIDVNHLGDAQYLNLPGAQAAISATNASFGCTTGSASAQIDCAIAAGATIADFAGNGLDSENVVAGGLPGANAAFAGKNQNWGQTSVLYPSGRSVYNALDVSLAGQVHHLAAGLDDLNTTVAYTYAHYDATGTASLGDADFGGNGWDNNHPTKYFGPTSLDRHNQFSLGLSLKSFYGVEFNTIAHLYSSLPTNLNLPTVGAGDIFIDDVNGSGVTGDLVPGTNVGSFNRQYNGKNINKLIGEYNATLAGKPSPAGQALITAGLFTSTQLTKLGGVLESLTPAPSNQVSNDILRTWDVTFGRTIHIAKERFTVRPTFAAFNILNAVNYNNRTGANGANVIGGQLTGQPGSPNGTPGHISEQNFRVSAGSGVYAEGSPRQMEYGLKVSF
jgi:hypothetical protein